MDQLERRRQQRVRTLKSARILLNHHRSALDCTVRNLSPFGACLNVASMIGIPERFDVIFDADHTIQSCRMVWHREQQIGVEFDSRGEHLVKVA